VAESFGQKQEIQATNPGDLDSVKIRENSTTSAQVELGNRLSQVVNDLRDGNVPRHFIGLQELSDYQRTVLISELQQVRKQFRGLGADKQPYREALDNLVDRYTSGELFSEKRD